MRDHNYHVYIMTNPANTVLYIGMTNTIERRVWEHKNHWIPGFTKKYNTIHLVYYEHFENVEEAIAREKQIKRWNRQKKEELIATLNPEWKDLAADWY
ncbi:MAG: GIY-YIG nuclease family protein [Candidatus Marinimicrobia bacterium]|nr:GIY-YIG nuclease family protein [Candidatus Neomarinimicrobiota bacterium]MCF7828728.1 GIY-YIG nuclease family protein [Candidatus Neomarinimicrobiota bacterium]MCF7880645.1 GIY-YIG nuclease family protein [Candidatus Neomarinimicrobiota bacterium]